MYGKGLRGLSIATAATLVTAFALAFFYAPMDAVDTEVRATFAEVFAGAPACAAPEAAQ